jgi:hypothetical protein
MAGNPTSTQPLSSVDDILAIIKLEAQEDAIIIVQDEIACLDDMSLEETFPTRYQISERLERKLFLQGVKFRKQWINLCKFGRANTTRHSIINKINGF